MADISNLSEVPAGALCTSTRSPDAFIRCVDGWVEATKSDLELAGWKFSEVSGDFNIYHFFELRFEHKMGRMVRRTKKQKLRRLLK